MSHPHPRPHPHPHPNPRPIVILGAGIIGLTTAIRLLESKPGNHPVHILADRFPSDPLDPRYASTAAGAHHLSFAADGDSRQRRWDRRTFEVMYDEWKREGESSGLMRIPQTEYMTAETHLQIYEEHPDFRVLERSVLPSWATHGVSFTSLTMTPGVYLASLLLRLDNLGLAGIHRLHLTSLSSLSDSGVVEKIGGIPIGVINCTGLGARGLCGVEDESVYPVRGQVVRIHAPWIREGVTRQIGSLGGGEGGERTYVIPRANGDVILGGTRGVGDWNGEVREETTRDILQRALEICPGLVQADQDPTGHPTGYESGTADTWTHGGTSSTSSTQSVDALEKLVLDEVVGFRPQRTAGTRLEREDLELQRTQRTQSSELERGVEAAAVVLVHNYGHGGAGWQSCWGTAEDAVGLVRDALGWARARAQGGIAGSG